MPAPDERLSFPRRELRARTARGVLVNAVFLGGTELLVLAQGLIVTALLGPRAIGLYGIVTITAVTIAQLRRVGIDEAFVQQAEQDQEEEFQRAFTIELGIAVVAVVAIAACAPLVALVYGDDRLLLLTLAVSYLPLAFALYAPQWIFFRRMDFVRVRSLQAIVPLVTFFVTVPLAAAGVGVWSLVIGPFVGNLAGVAAGVVSSPYRLRLRPSREALRRYVRFSWPVFVTALAMLVVLQGQILALDIEGGLAAVGYITLAATLTRYADRADQIVTTTIYPAICAIPDRVAALEELFVKSNRLGMAWALPFCVGLVLFSPDLVELVLGDRWEPAVVLLQGLAGAAAIQQLGYNWFSFYRARGDSAPQAVESAVMLGGFVLLAVPALFLWGFDGFVAGRIAGALLTLGVRRHYVRRLLPGVRLGALALRGMAPVAAGAGLALGLRLALWGGDRGVVQVAVELALFVAATGFATWLLERGLGSELLAYLRREHLPTAPPGVAPEPAAQAST